MLLDLSAHRLWGVSAGVRGQNKLTHNLPQRNLYFPSAASNTNQLTAKEKESYCLPWILALDQCGVGKEGRDAEREVGSPRGQPGSVSWPRGAGFLSFRGRPGLGWFSDPLQELLLGPGIQVGRSLQGGQIASVINSDSLSWLSVSPNMDKSGRYPVLWGQTLEKEEDVWHRKHTPHAGEWQGQGHGGNWTAALLVGLQTGVATVDNNTEAPQKIKNRATIWSQNPISGWKSKGIQIRVSEIFPPMFTAALFTTTTRGSVGGRGPGRLQRRPRGHDWASGQESLSLRQHGQTCTTSPGEGWMQKDTPPGWFSQEASETDRLTEPEARCGGQGLGRP